MQYKKITKFPLPPTMKQKQLNRATGLFRSYSSAYTFFKEQRDKYISIAKGYAQLIVEHETKSGDAIAKAESCEANMQAYENLMSLALGEVIQLEEQGGKHG